MQSEQLPKFSLFNAIVSDMNSKLLKLIRQSLKELTFDFENEYEFQEFVKSRITVLPTETKLKSVNNYNPQLRFLAILDYQTENATQLFDCTFTVN